VKLRIILCCLIVVPMLGFALSAWGWSDYQESHTASPQPDVIELADIEKGKTITNNHVRLGSHSALYYTGVYTYSVPKHSPKDESSKPTTSVTEYFYPIVSTGDPSVKNLGEALKKIEELQKQGKTIPPDMVVEPPSKFAVVVKTSRYKKVGDIPVDIRTESQVQGLILNHSKLGDEETKLLREEFPKMDMSKVIILEEGRTPSSTAWCFTRVALGILTGLAGLGIAGVTTIMAIMGK
jgi:hypothetical protein